MIDVEKNRIYVADLAKLNFEELFSERTPVTDIGYDGVERQLYWLEHETTRRKYQFWKSNVDGTNRTQVFKSHKYRSKYNYNLRILYERSTGVLLAMTVWILPTSV